MADHKAEMASPRQGLDLYPEAEQKEDSQQHHCANREGERGLLH